MGGRGGPGMGGGEYGMGGGPRHHEMSRHDLEGMDPYMQEAVCCTRRDTQARARMRDNGSMTSSLPLRF
jgi:hypothetical protein